MDLENIKISGLSYDSRKVKSGDVFVAIPGLHVDGYDFIEQAIKNGAKVVVAEKDFEAIDGVKKIIVKDARKKLAELASNFYGNPSKKLKMIGVTGTNGKTTTAYLIESILNSAGHKTGLIGTVETKILGRSIDSSMTTPESLELQAILSQMVEKGVTHVVMEVSSHSLAQDRVFGIEFDAVIFTNLTHDHLDFHKTMENYLEEKKKLFKMIKPEGVAIINVDDKYSKEMAKVVEPEIIFYGLDEARHELKSSKNSSIEGNLQEYSFGPDFMRFRIDSMEIKTPLIGKFNLYNILAAYHAAVYFGVFKDKIKEGIEKTYVPGRLELVDCGQDFKVFVDFAHSPDALEKVLGTLKSLCPNKIILVFGCPGDRDKEKRPIMFDIAKKMADYMIVTTDDPHTEDPKKIIEDIIKNGDLSENIFSIVDRHQAIGKAISLAQKGDIVVIAGRGHEKVQDFNGKNVPLDDREVVRNILKCYNNSKR